MAFRDIPNIEDYDFYIQNAFNKAKKAADSLRTSLKLDKLKKSKTIEIQRVKVVSISISEQMSAIIKSFPNLDAMTNFYKELVKITLHYNNIKRSLADIDYASKKVLQFSKDTIEKIKSTNDINNINKYRREFYGRVVHLLKKMKKSFEYLEHCRKTLVEFPVIKSMFTVAIAGFPNVGKSTLLKKLTGSNVEIKNYAFTTKQLLIGYATDNYEKIQFIDTPGTLNREKMNNIEMQAHLAMKYVADIIVYVFDPQEIYTIEDQEKLFKAIKKYEKPVIPYISKTDISSEKQVKKFEKFKCIKDANRLLEKIKELKRKQKIKS